MIFNVATFLSSVPNKPGIYRMINAKGDVIYVGKAKNLKKRLQSYFRKVLDSAKTQLMMTKVVDVQITVTNSENEALILENNLIKQLHPRYNIVMRDDKSYPYIALSKHGKFPRLSAYRGAKRKQQHYFGPYPNVSAVKESLYLLQKLFKIRSCTDTFFSNRSRPCLQYQIKRCSAPCVGYISTEDYQKDLQKAVLFLKNKSKQLVNTLRSQMREEAKAQHYEKAAVLRDQIEKLKVIQEQQNVMREKGNFDVVSIDEQLEQVGIMLLTINEGKLLGSQHFFPKTNKESLSKILSVFLTQHYLSVDNVPRQILVNIVPEDKEWVSSALGETSKHKVDIQQAKRGEKKRWLAIADNNLEQALITHIQQTLSQKKRIQILKETLQLPLIPQRIECFDISHSMGEATVAACVVFDDKGPLKKEYRRFNIADITPGDDYAALRQAILRRYRRLQKSTLGLPDLVIIDGGKGQLKQAIDIFAELSIENVTLISIAKGPGRNPIFDVIWKAGVSLPISLKSNSIALHTIQQIRDEAHRFAIAGHKQQRDKARRHSILEDIEGIGNTRRRNLLKAFDGLQGLKKASIADIAKVSGISEALALKIYHHLN